MSVEHEFPFSAILVPSHSRECQPSSYACSQILGISIFSFASHSRILGLFPFRFLPVPNFGNGFINPRSCSVTKRVLFELFSCHIQWHLFPPGEFDQKIHHYTLLPTQGCISCGILLSGIRARGVSSEHMDNMEMFSCSPT